MNKIIIGFLLCIAFCVELNAQTGGNNIPESLDTSFVFTSPRSLIRDSNDVNIYKNALGIDLLLSNAGVGIGFFYDRNITNDWKVISELFYSPMRNTDELESAWDSSRYEWIAPTKIRRLYIFPLTLGVQRYIRIGNLTKSFHPFISAILTPTYIWEMPYERNWFDDVKYSKGHFRFGGGLQIGADFGMSTNSLVTIKVRYTYVPFGGDGLESVKGSPIKNFGGLFLSLSLGGQR